MYTAKKFEKSETLSLLHAATQLQQSCSCKTEKIFQQVTLSLSLALSVSVEDLGFAFFFFFFFQFFLFSFSGSVSFSPSRHSHCTVFALFLFLFLIFSDFRSLLLIPLFKSKIFVSLFKGILSLYSALSRIVVVKYICTVFNFCWVNVICVELRP